MVMDQRPLLGVQHRGGRVGRVTNRLVHRRWEPEEPQADPEAGVRPESRRAARTWAVAANQR
jgi:hypothetical protein